MIIENRRFFQALWFDVVEKQHWRPTELGMPGMRAESVTSETFLKRKVSDLGCHHGDPMRFRKMCPWKTDVDRELEIECKQN